jgi:hypothetical protein
MIGIDTIYFMISQGIFSSVKLEIFLTSNLSRCMGDIWISRLILSILSWISATILIKICYCLGKLTSLLAVTKSYSYILSRATCQKVKFLYRLIKGMHKCGRCNNDSRVTYTCDHTDNLEMCSECYQQIHWEMT